MNFIKKNKLILLYFFFVFLIFLLILEKFLCHNNEQNLGVYEYFYRIRYSNYIYIFLCHDLFFDTSNLWEESNFIENLQAVLLFFSIILLFLVSIKFKKKSINIYYFLIIKCLGLIYFFGEEISWGQHFFKWESPNIFINHNVQAETNIHNISNLFDQLPRSLVLLWCSFSVILIMIIKKFLNIKKILFLIICPNKNLIYIALLLIFFILPDFIIDKFNLYPGQTFSFENPNEIINYTIDKEPPTIDTHKLRIFYDQITLKFLRLSEIQELIIAYYFFIYSFTLREEIKI